MNKKERHPGIKKGILAAKAGETAKLREWLDAGNDPNQFDDSGWTPLLWASARGNGDTVKLLLEKGADPRLVHKSSKALPVHLAGHSGDAQTAEIILEARPEHLDAVWDLNGHTILLQAVFYGHQKLTEAVLKKGAKTEITTARGLGPMELAAQFQNRKLMDIIKPFDTSKEAKAAYYRTYLARIAPVVLPAERERQDLADKMVAVIEGGIKKAASDEAAVDETRAAVRDLLENQGADVNRLGGDLQQPPLIVVVTGNNGLPTIPAVEKLRNSLAEYLLEKGADPTLHEKHPMGAQTIIRAAVFNHLKILKMCGKKMTDLGLAVADAINEIPIVNGLTAMHDTVLRATMAGPDRFSGYLDQTRWFVESGGRTDIEDFAGVTQRAIAENCEDPEKRRQLLEIMDAGQDII